MSADIEDDEDDAQVKLSYTFNLMLMQPPLDTWRRRSKSLGQITFEAMELFEDEDSVGTHVPSTLGILNTSALSLVLSRIQRSAGFTCAGFEYQAKRGGLPSASPAQIAVTTWAELDRCLEYIEDANPLMCDGGGGALDIELVPVLSFVFTGEGEGGREECRLEASARDLSWDWLSEQIESITGKRFACSYVAPAPISSDDPAAVGCIDSQAALNELLDYIFTGHHTRLTQGAALTQDDFLIRLRLVPVSTQITVASVPSGLPGAKAATKHESRSTLHVDLACVVKKAAGGKGLGTASVGESDNDGVYSFGKVAVSAAETWSGALQGMQALVFKALADYRKAVADKELGRPVLTAEMRQLPASVLDGKSRVVAFRFRREKSKEERKLDMGKEGEEDGENTGAQAAGEEEEWAMEDEDGLFGFKVSTAEEWAVFKEILMTDEDLHGRPVTLVLSEMLDGEQETDSSDPTSGQTADQKKVRAEDRAGSEFAGVRQEEVVGWAGRGGGGGGNEARARAPLKQIVLMCYDGNSDPVKMPVKPHMPWRDLSTQVAKLFGTRSNALRLCYKAATSMQVEHIETEQQLRKAVHEVQRKWQLGAGDGVLHCVIDSTQAPSASSQRAAIVNPTAPAIPTQEVGNGPGLTVANSSIENTEQKGGRLNLLHLAARNGDTDRVRALVSGDGLEPGQSKQMVNSPDSNGSTPLHYACDANALPVVELLIQFKADVNLPDACGCVPLHISSSCEEENLEQAAAAATRGEGVSPGDEVDEETREKEARELEELRGGGLVKLLIAQRARLNARDHSGWTALHHAASVDKGAAAAALINAGADVDAPTPRGFTPLHIAARYGSLSVSGYLVRADADVLRPNSDGSRAIDLCGSDNAGKELREATKRAMAIEHANKRDDNRASEVSALARGLVKLAQGEASAHRDGEMRRLIGKHEAENEVFRHFAKYDADKDGSLTREEFHAALQAPPYNVPFIQREKLHGYMDVDGDGTIDVEEFATAVFGRAPPALDKSYISIMVEELDVDAALVASRMPTCQSVLASVDFMNHHRSARIEQSIMIQQGSPVRPLQARSTWIALKHTQRMCVDPLTHHQNRTQVLDAIKTHQEMLRAEIILYGEVPASSEDGGRAARVVELGAGVLCLAPERAEGAERETRRVPIYTHISKAEQLPGSWREASAPHLLAIIRRTPLSLQACGPGALLRAVAVRLSEVCMGSDTVLAQEKLKAGDRGGPPTRAHMVQLLADWEREALQVRAAAAAADPEGASQRDRVRDVSDGMPCLFSVRCMRAPPQCSLVCLGSLLTRYNSDPIAVALVSVRATHVLDSFVVELMRQSHASGAAGGGGGIEALSDTWQARWTAK